MFIIITTIKGMKEKLSILTELIKLAKVDMKLGDEEYQFLQVIANLLGIEKEQLDSLILEYVEFTPPPLEVDRILQFQRLVLLANVDMKLDSSELNMLKKAGLKLGLNLEAVEIVLTEMKKSKNGMVPAGRLIKIFKVYHN